jgi:hypothetical protein
MLPGHQRPRTGLTACAVEVCHLDVDEADAGAAFDQPLPQTVTLGLLTREELHDRLSDGQLNPLCHWRPPKGSRTSTFWEAHVLRTHA